MSESIVQVPFVLPDGREVKLHAIDQVDFDVLCMWMKQTYLNDVSIAVATMPKEQKLKLIKHGLEVAEGKDFLSTRGQALLFGTTEGLARIGYQMITDKTEISFSDFLRTLFPSELFVVGGPASLMEGYRILDSMITAVYGEQKLDLLNPFPHK